MARGPRSPIRWFGGKGRMLAKLLPLLPKARIYVEPFGGGASVLLAREPAQLDVYNDLDGALHEFFHTLSNPRLFAAFKRRVEPLPHSRRLYNESLRRWRDQDFRCALDRVVAWYVVARQSFGGRFGQGWGCTGTSRTNTPLSWRNAVRALPEVHDRLQTTQIECDDWRRILPRHDTPDTLFYCDPPYPLISRKSGGYAHELSDHDHEELVAVLLVVRGMVACSSYESPLYAPLAAAEWNKTCWRAFTTMASLDGSRAVRREVLWRNPACIAACARPESAPAPSVPLPSQSVPTASSLRSTASFPPPKRTRKASLTLP